MSEFEIRDEPRRRTAVVHGSLAPDGIPAFMSRAFPAVFHAITAAGFVPGDAPFSRYFAFGPDRIELETGAPIADVPGLPERAFEGGGEVQPGELPAGPVAVGVHTGPYETIGETYRRMLAWVDEQGREPSGAMWEVYLTDPSAEPDPAKWRTRVFIPLA
jgi:effector-binding domain-containing protein